MPKDLVVQEADKPTEQSTEKGTAKFSDYSIIVFLYLLLMVGSYTFTNILSAEIAPYLENVRLGGAKESGLMVGVSLIGATLSGILFKKYIELLGSAAMTGVFVGTTGAWAAFLIMRRSSFVCYEYEGTRGDMRKKTPHGSFYAAYAREMLCVTKQDRICVKV